MTDVPVKAMEAFGGHGGLLGLVVFAIVVLCLAMLYGMYWYIKSERIHKMEQTRHYSEQYEKLLTEVCRLSDALNALAISIKGRPCMRGDTDRLTAHTRRQET